MMLLTILNGLTALTLGWIVLPVATVTETKPQLCAAMKGTYDPKAADQCVGGDWVRVVPILKELAPPRAEPVKKGG